MRTTVWVIHWTRGRESGVYKRVYEDGELARHVLETLEDSNESGETPFNFKLLELEKVVLRTPTKPEPMPEKNYGWPRPTGPHAHLVGQPGTPLPLDLFLVRTSNCLKSEYIETIEQLCCWTERELLTIPNLGRKSVNEVKEVLFSLGFKLKGQL
jgi:hypothetical protein